MTQLFFYREEPDEYWLAAMHRARLFSFFWLEYSNIRARQKVGSYIRQLVLLTIEDLELKQCQIDLEIEMKTRKSIEIFVIPILERQHQTQMKEKRKEFDRSIELFSIEVKRMISRIRLKILFDTHVDHRCAQKNKINRDSRWSHSNERTFCSTRNIIPRHDQLDLDEIFPNRSEWNTSQSNSDNQEEKKNCIPRWRSKRCRNFDLDEKKERRKHSTEIKSMTIQVENKLNEQYQRILLFVFNDCIFTWRNNRHSFCWRRSFRWCGWWRFHGENTLIGCSFNCP